MMIKHAEAAVDTNTKGKQWTIPAATVLNEEWSCIQPIFPEQLDASLL